MDPGVGASVGAVLESDMLISESIKPSPSVFRIAAQETAKSESHGSWPPSTLVGCQDRFVWLVYAWKKMGSNNKTRKMTMKSMKQKIP